MDFTQKNLEIILPAIKRMIESEEKHNAYLKKYQKMLPIASMINESNNRLAILKQRQLEYENHALKNW
jgi:hypothetical protein